uniref:T-cell surface antigen CD2-like n=1 Tax=Takifugu rubripes TaxID=31033 RepID=A0A674NZ74_TAKRU
MVMMGMKMAAVSSVSLLLLLTSIVTTTDSQDCNYHAAKKQDVTLPLTYVLKDSDQLRWLHGSKVIFDRRAKVMVTGNPDDVSQNGSLRLRNMDQSKAGTYTPTVYDDGQRIGNLEPMVLCVMDPVSQPQVTSECDKTLVTFTCMQSQTSPEVQFEWLEDGKVNPKLKERSFKGVLKDMEQRVYRCRVSNKVSSLTSAPFRQNCTQSDPVSQPQVTSECDKTLVTFTCMQSQTSPEVQFEWSEDGKVNPKLKERSFKGVLKDMEQRVYRCRVYNEVSSLTSAPFRQNCTQSVLDNGFIFPADIYGINIWIIIGGGGGVVLLLIIIVIICCVTNKRKKRMKIKDEEELRLGWSNSNPQCQHQNHPPDHQKQQPHQHTHRQQKPAGHSTGPRQHRCKQPPGQQRNQLPQVPSHQPEPGTRRAEQGRRQPAGNDSERPPLPQPRRKIQK